MLDFTPFVPFLPILILLAAVLSCAAGNVGRQRIAVLRDDFPYASEVFVDQLVAALDANAEVTIIGGSDLPELLSATPRKIDVLTLPDSRFFPARAVQPLCAYLEQGGHLLSVGGPAFSKLMVENQGKWFDQSGVADLTTSIEPAKLLVDMDQAVDSVSFVSGGSESGSGYRIEDADDPDIAKCIRVNIPALSSKELLVFDNLNEPFSGGYLTVFWAKGDASTAELHVEWREADGSHWFAKVDLQPRWRKYVIPAYEFKYNRVLSGSAQRGGTGDHFRPENAVTLTIGQRRDLTSNPEGSLSFSVARIGVAIDEFAGVDFNPPVLETLSPKYKTFRLDNATHLEPYRNQVTFGNEVKIPQPGEMTCPIWRPRGLGYQQKLDYRWIPLISAFDSSGEFRGAPVSMVLNVDNKYGGSFWGLVGFTDARFLEHQSTYVIDIIKKLLNRMQSGAFLQCAGTEHFSYLSNEKISVGVRTPALDHSYQVEMTIKQGDSQVYSHSWPTSEVKEELSSLNLSPGYYSVDTRLYESGKVVDRINYEFSIIDASRKSGDSVVTVKDGDFWLNGEKWYPMGINFWPLYCSAHESDEYRGISWQSPLQYDPEWIDLDLDQLVSLGMNSVSIQYPKAVYTRPIMDFLERCRDRDIRVNVSIDGHAISGDHWEAAELVRDAHLAHNDAVYSYDLAWEPHLGSESERKILDQRWRRWLEDQYGSVANAEQDWEFGITREDGYVPGPTDEQVSRDGAWNRMVAAYRRFIDDLVSKGYGRAVRIIGQADPNHLFGVRTGYGGTGQPGIAHHMPYDLVSGIKHLHYTSPEGYGLGGDYINYRRAGLLNLYGRFVSGGRPVFWSEYGVPHYFQGNTWSWSEEGQTRYFRDMHRMFLETDVSGGAGWWWPGGHRVDEDSDFGIINPDRTLRPAAIEVKKVAEAYKNPPQRKLPDYWIEIDRDLHANGLPMVWIGNWDEYIRAMDEGKTVGLKTQGTGTDSSNTSMIAVGNTRLNGHNPPKYLNAEFNWLFIQDATGQWVEVTDGAVIDVEPGRPIGVRASVGNTAESTWLTPAEAGDDKGGVYLCAGDGQIPAQQWPIPASTPYLEDVELPEFEIAGVDSETSIAFWMLAENRSSFGERLRFTLRPVGR